MVDSVWLVQEKHGMRDRSSLAFERDGLADVVLPTHDGLEEVAAARRNILSVAKFFDTFRNSTRQDRPQCSTPGGTSLDHVKCFARAAGGVELHEEALRFEGMLRRKGFWQATRDFVADRTQTLLTV